MPTPSNKIHQAKLDVAQRIVALDKLREGLGEAEDRPMLERSMRSVRGLRETEEGRAVLKAERLLENRLMQLATDPDIRPSLTCWMADFEGDEAAFHGDPKPEGFAGSEFMRAARADYGVVPRLVRRWLDDNNFEISDSGSGAGGWQLGVSCDDREAGRLCRLAHATLGTEMAAGAFTIALKFWGWKFTDMSTAHEARHFLNTELS